MVQSQYWIPTDDQMSAYNWTEDRYGYDSLNRLQSIAEYHGTNTAGLGGQDFKQVYSYDRFGNRSIDQGQTTTNVPHPNYSVDTNTNRLLAPIGYSYSYDNAGNQTNDTYTGGGSRTYDGENHLKQAWANSQWQTYTYDAGGRRIKRNVNGVETWQIYGIEGELLAEYQSGGAPFLPSREYGYRGSELLVTMSSGDDVRLARFVTNLYYGALQRDPTSTELQDKVNQLAAAGAQSQSQLLTVASQIARALFTGTNYETNSPTRSDIQYVGDLYYAYLQRGPDDGGLNWWAGQVPGSGRASVCYAFEASSEFQTLVATLYGTAASDNERTEHFVNNFDLAASGINATSTQLQTQRDALNAAAAQGLSQVQAQAESFGRSLFTAQVNDASLSNTQFVTNLYEAFLQRGPDAGGLSFWAGQATVGTGRQNVLNAFATCSSFYSLAGTLYREAFWLVTDHLGTPRMVVSKSGSLANVKRHDYLPFGEELYTGLGGRTTTQGYAGDSVRQHFTDYEADAETGLNFAHARYQSPAQGRFTSVDPLGSSASISNAQSFNRYSYVSNNPVNLTDPTGMMLADIVTAEAQHDALVGEAMALSAFNKAFNEGNTAQMRTILAANPSIGYEVGSAADPHAGEVTVKAEVTPPTEAAQQTETGADLAQRAETGLRNNPGLLEEIEKNTAPGVDVHIVACQAAKESNYSKLSRVPIPRKNAGSYISGAVGADGEIGLLQIFPATAGVSAEGLKTVGTNVKTSSKYLIHLKSHFNVGMREALAIYNWGPGKFNKANQDVTKIYSGSLSYADKILDCSRILFLPSDRTPYKFVP